MSTVPRLRAELATCTIADVVTGRGKELTVADTVASARRLFENPSLQVVPILQNGCYVGALDQGAVSGIAGETLVGRLAADIVPTALADTPASDALEALDETGLSRLVVLGHDGQSYVGLVCLWNDREHLCVDAECHADHTPLAKGH